MPDSKDRQTFLNLCEISIDSMYELAALGELLEPKGLITKQKILTLATELKQQNPSSLSFTPQENAVIDQLTEVIVKHGRSANHAKTLLTRTIEFLEWGKQAAHETSQANA